MEERGRFLNSLSNVPPPPFHVGDIVVRQPSEREIYLKQIEPWVRKRIHIPEAILGS